MGVVIVEAQRDDRWVAIGTLGPHDPLGSISSQEDRGRQVYLFGWRDAKPGVWRSAGGWDVESPALRVVSTVALEPIADLTSGPFEMQVWHPSRTFLARFRLADA